MHKLGHVDTALRGAIGQVAADTVDDRAGIIIGCGGQFTFFETAIRLQEDQIGEGAADIDADPGAGTGFFNHRPKDPSAHRGVGASRLRRSSRADR